MTIEEKAIAYDKAIEKIKYVIEHGVSPTLSKEDLQDLFSELFESEDEQHRKWILEYLYDGLRKSDEQFKPQFESAIAWLKKQAQVKETAIPQHENKTCKENDDSLTCEDEKIRKEIIDFLWKEKIFLEEIHLSVENSPKYRFVMDAIAWLEKQKDYVPPQMVADAYLRGCNDTEKKWLEKQGQTFSTLSNSSNTEKKWTEEDEDMFKHCIGAISIVGYIVNSGYTPKDKEEMKLWLNSLKQRMEE